MNKEKNKITLLGIGSPLKFSKFEKGKEDDLTNYFHNKFKDEGKYVNKRFMKEIINHCTQQKSLKSEKLDEMPNYETLDREKGEEISSLNESIRFHSADTHDKPLDRYVFDRDMDVKQEGEFEFCDVKQFLSKVLEDIEKSGKIEICIGEYGKFISISDVKQIIKSRAGQSFFEGDKDE